MKSFNFEAEAYSKPTNTLHSGENNLLKNKLQTYIALAVVIQQINAATSRVGFIVPNKAVATKTVWQNSNDTSLIQLNEL